MADFTENEFRRKNFSELILTSGEICQKLKKMVACNEDTTWQTLQPVSIPMCEARLGDAETVYNF